MPSSSDQIANGIRAHQTRVFRVAEGVNVWVRQQLTVLRSELVSILADADPTEPTRLGDRLNRVDSLTAAASKIVASDYKRIDGRTATDVRDLAASDQSIVAEVIAKATGGTIETVSTRALERIVERALVEGAPASEWWRRQAADVVRRYHDQIREGMQAGESIGDLIRRVKGTGAYNFQDGVMAIPERHAESLVRTSVLSALNDARLEEFRKNADIIRGAVVDTVFDSRTCEECMGFSGAVYDLNGDPLPESPVQFPLPTGGLPLHMACRCGWTALLKGEAPPTQMSYEIWLKQQPVADQIEILGPRWHAAWASGRLPSLRDRITQRGRAITLAELRSPVKEAA